MWASWCGPVPVRVPGLPAGCAAERGKRVAFLGVDTDDSDDAAQTFLDELPLPYPSVTDPDKRRSRTSIELRGFPSTAFYDAAGELRLRQAGPVHVRATTSRADIDRYAQLSVRTAGDNPVMALRGCI